MTPADKPKFMKQLLGLSTIKPGKELTSEAYEIWWRSMQDWTLADFIAATEQLAKTVEFMPSPFHYEQLRKAGRMTPGEAWERARAACGSAIQCGQVTHNGTSGDQLIDVAVRAIGGYGAIAMCDRDKLTFLERRFTEHYERIQDAQDIRDAVPQIARPSIIAALANAKRMVRK